MNVNNVEVLVMKQKFVMQVIKTRHNIEKDNPDPGKDALLGQEIDIIQEEGKADEETADEETADDAQVHILTTEGMVQEIVRTHIDANVLYPFKELQDTDLIRMKEINHTLQINHVITANHQEETMIEALTENVQMTEIISIKNVIIRNLPIDLGNVRNHRIQNTKTMIGMKPISIQVIVQRSNTMTR